MMISGDDVKKLRLPLAAALVLVGIGVGALLACDRLLDEARSRNRSLVDELGKAKARIASVSEEEREIRDNLVHFKAMAGRGMVGPEKRLEWIESIIGIRQKRRLFDVRYQVEAQHPLDYPGVTPPAKGEAQMFMVSRMKLDLKLLHEEDLFNFLDDLKAFGNAFVSVRSCSMTRADTSGAAGGPLRPRLSSICTVDFVTLRLPGAA